MKNKSTLLGSLFAATLVTALSVAPQSAQAQIFATNIAAGTVGEYSTTGTVINDDLISLSGAYGIADTGSLLYVGSTDLIKTYNTDGTGAATFTSTSGWYSGITVSGGVVYASDRNGAVDEFNASTGALLTSFSDTGTAGAGGIAVLGSDIFVSSIGSGTVTEYTLAGTPVLTLASDLNTPTGLALTPNGLDLLIGVYGSGQVFDYNFGAATLTQVATPGNVGGVATDGTNIFSSSYGGGIYEGSTLLVSTPTGEFGLALAPSDTPEPTTAILLGLGGLLTVVSRRFRRTL